MNKVLICVVLFIFALLFFGKEIETENTRIICHGSPADRARIQATLQRMAEEEKIELEQFEKRKKNNSKKKF